jgi:5-hydroxyisourate hydrolase
MGRLTTHVLDLSTGKPAEGVKIDLRDGEGRLLKSAVTNKDGRVDGAILEGDALRKGKYELQFHAGDYLKSSSHGLPEPLFLDVVPIAFGVSDPLAHYHVPLLLSPFGYSTYRGS